MFRFIKLFFLDCLNYIYFRRVVSKFNKTEKWEELRLRQNAIGEIYTVVRLRDEDLGDPDEIMMNRMMDVARNKNIFISEMDIQFSIGGLVVVDYYNIEKDPNAFLVIWQPKLQVMSIGNGIKILLIISLIFILLFGMVLALRYYI